MMLGKTPELDPWFGLPLELRRKFVICEGGIAEIVS